MADITDKATRSRMMAGIRGRDTQPELAVRRALHAKGIRYRLHAKGLPGRPDLVFSSRRAVIFVHGCFWHQHGCSATKKPKTRTAFWNEKLRTNVSRDRTNVLRLRAAGWRVAVVWECSIRAEAKSLSGQLYNQLASWLDTPKQTRIVL
jgi:DNA mismatch endonuclease (patch repair protein)